MKEGELQELLGGWVWTRLEEISDIILGQSPPSSTYNEDRKGLPFYQGKLEFGNVYPIPQKWCSAPNKIAEKGDVLISVRAPVGPTNICPEKSCIGRGLAAICPLAGIETFFTLYLMRAFKNSIAEKGTGTTFDAITGIQLKEFDIPLPPLPEQRAIISKIEQILSDLDNGIENFKKAQAQLKLYRQSVLKAACEGKLVQTEAELARAEGRDYEAADLLLARILKERREKSKGSKYKEPATPDISGLPFLPEGWKWINLGQITWSVRDGPYYSPKYATEGIPFISGGNVRPNGVDFDNAKRISPELHSELSKRCKPKKGDILYTKGGTTGIARVNTYDLEFNVWVHVAVLKLAGPAEPFYVQHALNSQFCYAQSQRFTHGVGNQDLGLTRMVNIILGFPPLAEQRHIVAEVERRLSVSDKMEATITESLKKAESLRQSILKKAFEGKLLNKKELEKARKAPDWEPAEKLLERIKAEKVKVQKNTRRSKE